MTAAARGNAYSAPSLLRPPRLRGFPADRTKAAAKSAILEAAATRFIIERVEQWLFVETSSEQP